MAFRLLLPIGFGWLVLSACVPYKPTLFLDNSPVTIPVRVQVLPLYDASPQDDREPATSNGFAQTSADSLEEELSTLVTRAILADFSATSVFKSIATMERGPDLILSGTINRFYGEVTLPSWAKVPGVTWAVSVFWSPVQERHGMVDLELTLSRPEGEVLGRYRGCEEYAEIARHDHHYWSMPVYPAHRRLNQLFTEAVRQIRDQILDDREYLVAALHGSSVSGPGHHVSESPPCEPGQLPVEEPMPAKGSRRRQ